MKILIALFFVLFMAAGTTPARAESFEAQYQHDMDIVRLNDLRTIGALIEEYKTKTGNYPLIANDNVPVYAHIATREQQDFIKKHKGPPYKHVTVPTTEFIALLEKGLGRKIDMPFDLQRVASGRQHFYSYMTKGAEYFLGVHLYGPQPFAQKIGKDWYKVEISNLPSQQPLIWDYQALMADPTFQKAAAEKPIKPGYAEKLREKLRKDIGF